MHTLRRQLDIAVCNSSERAGGRQGLEIRCIVTEAIGVGALKKEFWGNRRMEALPDKQEYF